MLKNLLGCTLIALLATTTLSHAQKFTPGYYVKSGGDTVKTSLFLRKKNGEIVGLETRDRTMIDPSMITAAGIGNVDYLVRKVKIDLSPKVVTDIEETVVLEILVREKMSLLYSIDAYDKAHYFVEDENGKIEELGLRILDRGAGLTFQELPTYKDKFKALFPTCKDALADKIEKTGYGKKSILSTFQELYECKYGVSLKVASSGTAVSDFGILAGISSSKLKFSGIGDGNTLLLVGWDFPKSVDPTGGIFMNTRFARAGNSLSLRQELTYRKYDVTSGDYYKGQNSMTAVGHISANYLKYNISLRVALTHTRLRPFISVGLSGGALLSSSNSAVFDNGTTQTSRDVLGKTRGFEPAAFGGAGLTYDDLSLEARFERSGGLDPQNADSKVSTVYVLLSYRVFKGKGK